MLFFGRDPGRALLAYVVISGIATWAVIALLGRYGIAAVGGVLGGTLGWERMGRRQLGSWANRRAVAGAVLDRRDPGPTYRERVEDAARRTIREHVLGQLFLWLFLGGFAVGCLATAVVRTDWLFVCPGVALLACTAWASRVDRRAVRRARAWLRASGCGGAAP